MVAFVRGVEVDGGPLRANPWVRERLARLAVDIEAARMLGAGPWRAFREVDS